MPLHPEKLDSEKGSQLTVEAGEVIRANADPQGGTDVYRLTVKVPAQPQPITGLRLDALKSSRLPAQGPGRGHNGNFVLSEVQIEANGKPVKLVDATATFEQGGFPAKNVIDGKSTQKKNGWAVMGGTGADQSLYLQVAEPISTTAGTTLVFTLRFPY